MFATPALRGRGKKKGQKWKDKPWTAGWAGVCDSGAVMRAQAGLMDSFRPRASVNGMARPRRPAPAPGTSPTCSQKGCSVLLADTRGKSSRKHAMWAHASSNVCFHPWAPAGEPLSPA